MELHKDEAVVLTPDGAFCRIPRTQEMAVGEEVAFDRELRRSRIGRSHRGAARHGGWWSAAAGAAAVLVVAAGTWLFGGVLHPTPASAYTWVSIDINPSIALEVDDSLKVVAAEGTDADGEQLVTQVHLSGLPLEEAAQSIVDYAEAHDQLAADATILVSIPAGAKENASAVHVREQAVADVQHAISQAAPQSAPRAASVVSVTVPEAVWTAAQQAHVSPGRLMSVLVAAKEGQAVGVATLQGGPLQAVWSNPKAKEAVQSIQESDVQQLEQWLSTLTSEGAVGGMNPGHEEPGKADATGSSGTHTANNVPIPGSAAPPGRSAGAGKPGNPHPGPDKGPGPGKGRGHGPGGDSAGNAPGLDGWLGNVANGLIGPNGLLSGGSWNMAQAANVAPSHSDTEHPNATPSTGQNASGGSNTSSGPDVGVTVQIGNDTFTLPLGAPSTDPPSDHKWDKKDGGRGDPPQPPANDHGHAR